MILDSKMSVSSIRIRYTNFFLPTCRYLKIRKNGEDEFRTSYLSTVPMTQKRPIKFLLATGTGIDLYVPDSSGHMTGGLD